MPIQDYEGSVGERERERQRDRKRELVKQKCLGVLALLRVAVRDQSVHGFCFVGAGSLLHEG